MQKMASHGRCLKRRRTQSSQCSMAAARLRNLFVLIVAMCILYSYAFMSWSLPSDSLQDIIMEVMIERPEDNAHRPTSTATSTSTLNSSSTSSIPKFRAPAVADHASKVSLRIPRIIWQSFKTEHVGFKYAQSVRTNVIDRNPFWEYHFLNDSDITLFMENHFSKTDEIRELSDLPILETFHIFNSWVAKVDFWRILVIYLYGGVYLDIDTYPRMAFDAFLSESDEFVTAISGSGERIVQMIVISIPKHLILRRVIEIIVRNALNFSASFPRGISVENGGGELVVNGTQIKVKAEKAKDKIQMNLVDVTGPRAMEEGFESFLLNTSDSDFDLERVRVFLPEPRHLAASQSFGGNMVFDYQKYNTMLAALNVSHWTHIKNAVWNTSTWNLTAD